jgi:hypothetical protein
MGDPRPWWAAVRSGRAWLAHHSDPDGTLVAAHYGSHADDQWSVDDLLRSAAPAETDAGAPIAALPWAP